MKVTLLTGLFITLLSIQSIAQSQDVIWNGKGDATQSVTAISSNSKTIVEYKFENVRFGSIVDKGSFYILNQTELNQLISDLEGAVEKSGEVGGFEWARGIYTIKSGGNNSPKKGMFKIWIGEKHCPMDKKNASKLIKSLNEIMPQIAEEEKKK